MWLLREELLLDAPAQELAEVVHLCHLAACYLVHLEVRIDLTDDRFALLEVYGLDLFQST